MKPYIPPLLPPKIDYSQLIKEISEANRTLGELKGLLANIPNPSLLMTPLLTKEAVASSKIEGTQATLEEVFQYEAEGKSSELTSKEQDIHEIINYRIAIRAAVDLLKKRPIGENFIKYLHGILLDSVRGAHKDKGSLRKIPVFIGKPGATIENAIYIPPPVQKLPELLSNWEKYINSDNEPDALVQTAIAHYQFEAIHSFLDGNGRIGRLLIPITLYQKQILNYPLLYVSEYFENNRDEYYHYLRQVDREQEWEQWVKYFLISLKTQARDTQSKVTSMLDLYRDVKVKLNIFASQYAINLLDIIFENPIVSFTLIKDKMKTGSNQTIYNLLEKFQSAGILREAGTSKRNRTFIFEDLITIIR